MPWYSPPEYETEEEHQEWLDQFLIDADTLHDEQRDREAEEEENG